jgi:hypothetical protein
MKITLQLFGENLPIKGDNLHEVLLNAQKRLFKFNNYAETDLIVPVVNGKAIQLNKIQDGDVVVALLLDDVTCFLPSLTNPFPKDTSTVVASNTTIAVVGADGKARPRFRKLTIGGGSEGIIRFLPVGKRVRFTVEILED